MTVCWVEDVSECRLDEADDSCELAGTSGLFLVEVVKLYLLADCFSIVDCGVTELYGDPVFSFDSFSIDFQVKFSHS